jgi:hypothetical protein
VIVLEEGGRGVWSRRSIVSTGGLNHDYRFTAGGRRRTILVRHGSLTVFRWKINLKITCLTRQLPERVIVNMNADVVRWAHWTPDTDALAYDIQRTLRIVGFRWQCRLTRFSRIRRFDLF